MMAIAFLFVRMLGDCFKSRQRLEAEILVLRHQLNVLQQRAPRRVHLHWASRALFIWLYRCCPRILDAITIVRPETVVRWHRMGFAAYWRWKSRSPGGRPRIGKEVRDLIRRMQFCLSGCHPQPLAVVFGRCSWTFTSVAIFGSHNRSQSSSDFFRRRGLRRLPGEGSLERRVCLPHCQAAEPFRFANRPGDLRAAASAAVTPD